MFFCPISVLRTCVTSYDWNFTMYTYYDKCASHGVFSFDLDSSLSLLYRSALKSCYIIFMSDIVNAISYILLYQRLPFSPVNDTCSLLSFYPRSRKQWIDSENILQRVISRRRFRQYATFVSYYFSPKLRICVARYQAAGHV